MALIMFHTDAHTIPTSVSSAGRPLSSPQPSVSCSSSHLLPSFQNNYDFLLLCPFLPSCPEVIKQTVITCFWAGWRSFSAPPSSLHQTVNLLFPLFFVSLSPLVYLKSPILYYYFLKITCLQPANELLRPGKSPSLRVKDERPQLRNNKTLFWVSNSGVA